MKRLIATYLDDRIEEDGCKIYYVNIKKIVILLLFVLTNGILVNAQEKYHFTINPEQDTTVVYDAQDNVVFLYGKDVFVYRQTPIKVTKDKKVVIFLSSDEELGRVSSKKYRKIHLADGNMYVLVSEKKEIVIQKNGHVCASSKYSYSISYPYFEVNKVEVEMSVDTDLNFIPFLFQIIIYS
jgi:hypothetical protein